MLEIQGTTNALTQRTGLLFVVVLIGHLILISAQVQSKSGVPVLESTTFGLFSRIQLATASVVGGVQHVWGNYVGLRGARQENETLRQQVADLEVELHQEQALAAQAAGLQALLDLRQAATFPTVAASIIAGNPNPGMLTVTIDRGSADGVQTDMAVIAPKGVVGRVVGQPASHAARVQLIIDHEAAAGALIERTRAGGMIVGAEGDPPLQMQLVSNLADVITGDSVTTSGVDGVYPKGIPIGRVEQVERGSGLYREITVRPAVDFSGLEHVLVVLVAARPVVPEPAAPAAPDAQAPAPAPAK